MDVKIVSESTLMGMAGNSLTVHPPCIYQSYYDSLKRCCLEHLWNSSAPHCSLTIMSKGKFFPRSERSTQALSRLLCHLKSFPPEAGSVYPKCAGQVYMAGIYQEHYCQKTKKNTQKNTIQ